MLIGFLRDFAKRFAPFRSYSSGVGIASPDSTIYALATGGIRSAIAIIRVSGKETSSVLKGLIQGGEAPQPRRASLRRLFHPKTRTLLDHGLVLYFPGPNSYTREDLCEFHIHGGVACVNAMLEALGQFSGVRMAEPGEFTRRAFLNGKMDLTEIDGLSDLINAETEMQRVQALSQMGGALGKLYEGWRGRIAKNLANAEAFIDFGEDENIESNILSVIEGDVEDLIHQIENHLGDGRRGELLRRGVRTAIIGRPNVGKSSLLNLLCKRDAAITSPIAGTTRDVLESTINIGGFPVIFADTAGIHGETQDEIEQEGIKRALDQVQLSDLIILLLDPKDLDSLEGFETPNGGNSALKISDIFHKLFQGRGGDMTAAGSIQRERVLIILNKLDLLGSEFSETSSNLLFDARISCKTNEGIELFLEKLNQRIASMCADPKSVGIYLTQERYRNHLIHCAKALRSYLESDLDDLALKTNLLKSAMNSIGSITGHFGTEDILDIIFKDFCIGK